ncbi:noelin [Elysia marginata]|uniref:Noelin n=1 Tax=Elysia marginata TaxID=1093978 RepID=A0AAV4IHL6_9GAST|nr:noelin [Elysia marginata]
MVGSWTLPELEELRETLESRTSVTSKGLAEWWPQRPASDHRTVNAMRVTAGVTACGQMIQVCSKRTLRQVTSRRREDSDPQQPGSVRRMSGCREEPEQQTWIEATSELSSKLTQLSVGSRGLWAIYATNVSAGKVVISKIDHKTMELGNTWMTSYPKRSLGNAVMICGTLYATDSHRDVPTFIRYVYNTDTAQGQLLQPGELTFLNSALVGRPNVFARVRRPTAPGKRKKQELTSVTIRDMGDRKLKSRKTVDGRRKKTETRDTTHKSVLISKESNSVMLSYDFRTSSLLSWNNGRLETFPVYFRTDSYV